MKIQLNYGTAVAAVPASALEYMDRATKNDLKVLLTICADISVLRKDSFDECVENLITRTGLTKNEIEFSLSFWRVTGIVCLNEEDNERMASLSSGVTFANNEKNNQVESSRDKNAKKDRKEVEIKIVPDTHLPRYSSEELVAFLESRSETRENIEECSRIWKDVLHPAECSILIGIVDLLKLDWDYMLSFLSFYVNKQEKKGLKKSFRDAEKLIIAFYDEGVRDLLSLQERIKKEEQLVSMEGDLRHLFGIGTREFSKDEKVYFSKWLYNYNYDMSIIRIAYNEMVNSKGKIKYSYMDGILNNWFDNNLKTVAEVENYLKEYRESLAKEYENEKQKKKNSVGSKTKNQPVAGYESTFVLEDFFDAAVRRSLGDDFDPDKKDA